MKAELELIETADLLDEIMSRVDAGIFCTMKVMDGDGADNEAQYAWKGSALLCIGLASEMQHRILRGRASEDELNG